MGICNSDGWPSPSSLPHQSPKEQDQAPSLHEPTLPQHRSQRPQVYQTNSHGGITPPQPRGSGNAIIHQGEEDPVGMASPAHLPSSLFIPFPLHVSTFLLVWSVFYLPSTSYPLPEFQLFLLCWLTPEGNIISPTCHFFHFTSRGKSVREPSRSKR